MQPNIMLTGDQARLLIGLMTNDNVVYKGSSLPDVYLIFGQLLAISNVQPPTQPPANSSS
jgi:hypothetical protein